MKYFRFLAVAIATLFLPAIASQINGTCSCLPTSIVFTFRLDDPEACPEDNGGRGINVDKNPAISEYVCVDQPNPQVNPPVVLTRIEIQEIGPLSVNLKNSVIEPDLPIPLGGQFGYETVVGNLGEYPITSLDKLPVQFVMNLEAENAEGNALKQNWTLSLNTDERSCESQIFEGRMGSPGYTGWIEFTSIVPPFAYLCPGKT